jgi:hypothetical protein
LKDLFEKSMGNAMSLSNRFNANGLPGPVIGQIKDPAECVLNLSREPHRMIKDA